MQLQQRHGDTRYYRSHCASKAVKQKYQQIQTAMQSTPPNRLNRMYAQLFESEGPVFIEPDFFCQTPAAVNLGAGVFFNHNCCLLGEHNIIIGKSVLIGPNVIISTRALGEHSASKAPVVIEDNVWIGANSLILAGAHIHDSAIIGAGATVDHCVPATSIFINALRYKPGDFSQR